MTGYVLMSLLVLAGCGSRQQTLRPSNPIFAGIHHQSGGTMQNKI